MNLNDYELKEKKNRAKIISLMEGGVEFVDINTAYISEDVCIGEGTLIGPCVTLQGVTTIGKNCKIYQNTRISDSVIGDCTTIENSVILSSKVGSDTSIGPFAYVRPNSCIGDSCKIGDFVEVKNANIGNGTKSAHLTYIGDADLGEKINIGCGVVFVNYDGKNKHRSTVEDGVFIGCNSNIVSPIDVKRGSYIAAGTTLTKDVPEDSLAIGRSRQKNIENWAKEKSLYNKK